MSSQNQDMSQYLGIFLDEGQEQLSLLESEVLRMERGERSPEILQSMFRAAHTLKGSSRAMGFLEIGNLTHELENVLDDLRNDKLELTPAIIDAFLDGLDALNALMDSVAQHGSDANTGRDDIKSLVERLDSLRTGGVGVAKLVASESGLTISDFDRASIEDARSSGQKVYRLDITLEETCVMKSIRIFMVIAALEPLGTILKTDPSESDIEQEKIDTQVEMLLASNSNEADIENAIKQILEIASVKVDEYKDQQAAPQAKGDSSKNESDLPTVAAVASSKSDNKQPSESNAAGQTIRVGLNRLDALLNLVGELVIDRTQIVRLVNELKNDSHNDEHIAQLQEAMNRVSRITSELQEEVMKTRMLPIDGVFQRLPRMVRDLAQKTGKEIDFQMSGGETELDRSVIEVLGDPLIHMLRNSVDHGVEPPQDRKAAGKPAAGRVTLSARYEESHIVIEIADDGRGMDPDAIRAAAVKKGLISEQAANALTDREALNLIMASGFSTAAVISDISGRGVGMDIVKSNLEKIGGRIFIDSKIGVGSKFSVHLPLTLAIVRALLVVARNQTFVVPLSSVVEMLSLKDHQSEITQTTVAGQSVVVVRGDTIPLANLWDLLSADAHATHPDRIGRDAHVVVISNGDRRVGICVDSVAGEQEVVIKSMGPLLGEIPGISGASILGDGRVALIVDVATAVEEVRNVTCSVVEDDQLLEVESIVA